MKQTGDQAAGSHSATDRDGPASEGPSFETALATLAEIVGQLEQGELSLSDSLARYEQGVRLLRDCYDLLESAERRVELLRGFDASGNPVTAPFEAQAMDLDEKAGARSVRRGASPRRTPDARRGVDGTTDSI